MKKQCLMWLFLIMSLLPGYSQTIALFEDFESAPYNLTSSGTPAWTINSRLHATGLYSDSCTLATSSTSYLTSGTFSTIGNSSVILEFSQICKIEMGDAAQIEYSLNGGTTWTLVSQTNYTGAGSFASNKFTEFSYPTGWSAGNATAKPDNTWWKAESFDLSVALGNQASVMIRFKLNDANNSGAASRPGWFLDDIKVTMAPSELVPPVITLLPPVLQDTLYTTGPFEIKAAITDASGIDTAYIVYSLNAGPNDTLGMTVLLADTFHAFIPAQAYNTRIDYHVAATDASAAANHANSSNHWFFLEQPAPVVVIGTGTSTTPYLPAYGYYDYSWSDQIYTAAEIGMSGFIDSIFFNVSSVTAGYTLNNQSIYIESTPQGSFSSAAFPSTTGMTQIFSGNYTFAGTGWTKIAMGTPFYYNGSDNLRIVWLNNDGAYSSGYPNFYYTSTSPVYAAQYNYQDGSMPTSGNLTYNRPNLKIAFQLNNNSNDVAMMQMTEPFSSPTPVTGTPYPVKVIFRNVGSDTLTSLTINWSIDGVLQTPYSWNGSMLQDQNSPELTLGSVTYTLPGSHVIKAWSTLPNGIADEGPANDTIARSYFVCSALLAGTYTINPVVPTGGTNFQYFSDVINALTYCGVSDTTVFNIAAGTYDTLLSIPEIPGAGLTATVTFRSGTGNAADVILQNNAVSAGDNFVFALTGSRYVNIENLTINALGANYGRCILFKNGCNNIQIRNNIIQGLVATFQSSDLDLICSYSADDTTLIICNNTLSGGSTGISLAGSYGTGSNNLIVCGNNISNHYSAGVSINNASEVIADSNVVVSLNPNTYSYGMYFSAVDQLECEFNQVNHNGYSSLYLDNVTNSSGAQNTVINNFLAAGGSADNYSLYLNYTSNTNVFHNSANCYSTSTSNSAAFYDYEGSYNYIKNNIFANTKGGKAIIVNYATDTLDYNNLYSTGSTIGQYSYVNVPDLTNWQTTTTQDQNSVSINPLFISDSELHTLAFSANDLGFGVGVTTDIDNEVRNLTTPDIGADEFTPPMQEAGVAGLLSPNTGCGLGLENVEIRIANNGLDTINGNLMAYYAVNGGTPVSQAVTSQILSGDTLDFTFTTQADLTVTTTDQMFAIKTWIALTGDPIPANDTLLSNVASMHLPAPVVVTNATIPYGTSATLTATSSDTIQWYADASLISLLNTGSSFTTPVLYDTTVYYVASTSGLEYKYTFDTDLQGWSALTPCPSYTSYNWTWDSDAGLGTAFMVNPYSTSSAVLQSPLMNVFGNEVTLSYKHRYETESCCDRMYVAYRIDGGAWTIFTPTTGQYDGADGLSVDPFFGSCSYTSATIETYGGSALNYFTSSGTIQLNGGTQLEVAFVSSSDGSVNFDGWYIDEVSVVKPGCPGQVANDTVFVTGIPAVDVGVIAIDEPNSGLEMTANEDVTIRVKNYGTSVASNIPVNFTINGGAAVSEILAGPVAAGDTAVYTFTAKADLFAYATHDVTAYTTLTGDTYPVNDTCKKQVINSPLIYCVSGASSTGDEDIGNVTIGNLNNTSSSPYTGTYTDYSTSVAPAYLALGQSFPFSVTVVTGGSTYSGYCEAYIDFNHDGVFTEPGEIVFGSAYSTQPQTLTGTVNIPLTAVVGNTRMRVVVQESGSATATMPCGTYGWGETEDYTVTLAPQIPFDAGVVSIDEPEYIQSESSSVPVIVTVKNFGSSTLTSIPIEYVANGGAPVAYTWTGSLASNASIQITLPDLTVLPDSNEICAYTLVPNDSNLFNDNSCAWFYGLPPAVVFEDDMENGTYFYTDAATLWEYGEPTATVINNAHSPVNVWTTILDGNYPNAATGYIYSPLLNFFGVSGAYLTFYYWIDAEENYDGGFVQYTVNNGTTWNALGSINDPNGFNWYDSYASGTPGWTKNTNGWTPAFIRLDAVSGYSSVKIRFGFKSNTSTAFNGFAIDDIKILGPKVSIDGGIVEIVNPTVSATPGTQTSVSVRIKNFGTDTLTSIPLAYTLDTGYPPQNGTWTGTLLPDDTTTYTFTQTYPCPSVNYRLCSFTKITADPYKSNDSTCVYFSDIIGIDETSLNGVTLLQNVPNPAADKAEISFLLPENGTCMLTLRNTLGELIQTTTLDGQTGKNSVNVDLSNLGQGIYVYTLEYKDVVLTRRLSVIK